MQAGYVYIVHGIGTSYIKVGKTTHVERRLRDLGHAVPFPLRLLYTKLVHDMDASECQLKTRYAAYRTRGEWFELPAEALAVWPAFEAEVPEVKATLRLVPPKPTLQDKILKLFEVHPTLTVRKIQQALFQTTAPMIKQALHALVREGVLVTNQEGKRLLYRRTEAA